MLDLLTIEEDKVAAGQGWGLYHVFDAKVNRWGIRILPADAAENVVRLAKNGDPIATRALRIITLGTQKNGKRK